MYIMVLSFDAKHLVIAARRYLMLFYMKELYQGPDGILLYAACCCPIGTMNQTSNLTACYAFLRFFQFLIACCVKPIFPASSGIAPTLNFFMRAEIISSILHVALLPHLDHNRSFLSSTNHCGRQQFLASKNANQIPLKKNAVTGGTPHGYWLFFPYPLPPEKLSGILLTYRFFALRSKIPQVEESSPIYPLLISALLTQAHLFTILPMITT